MVWKKRHTLLGRTLVFSLGATLVVLALVPLLSLAILDLGISMPYVDILLVNVIFGVCF
jgi:hypothetical protein